MRAAEPGRATRRALAGAVALAAWSLVASLLSFLLTRPALADGAFPDSQIILTPADAPGEIILITNFGLLRSQDGGATWLWACEQLGNQYGFLYQLGLPPRHRLYAVANQQVVFSDDRGCGWTPSNGLLPAAGAGVSDLWVDRAVADRVLAVDVTSVEAGQRTHALFESTDDGATFPSRLYQAEPGAAITGAESARSSPATIYVTLAGAGSEGGAPPPQLAQTTDGGAHWRVSDLGASVGAGMIRLVAVDPIDPQKVFLLWSGVDGQALVLTGDAGATARKVLTPAGVMKSFLQLASGTILVSADDSGTAGLYRSRDGGATFDALAGPPHVRALAERDGTVYAATDNFSEGYAVGVSADEGDRWVPLLAYQDVRAIEGCLKASCQDICQAEAQISLWPEDVCAADAPEDAPDAGPDAADATAGRDAAPELPPEAPPSAGDAGALDRGATLASDGCHCGVTPTTPATAAMPRSAATVGLGAGALAALLLRARRRAKISGPRDPRDVTSR